MSPFAAGVLIGLGSPVLLGLYLVGLDLPLPSPLHRALNEDTRAATTGAVAGTLAATWCLAILSFRLLEHYLG